MKSVEDLLDRFTSSLSDLYNNYCGSLLVNLSDPTGDASLISNTLSVQPNASSTLGLNSFDLIVSLQDFPAVSTAFEVQFEVTTCEV